MCGFILSSHPVWQLLYSYGLPHEIINIIFSYKTYYTPIIAPFKEFTWSMNEYESMRGERTFIYSDLVDTFVKIFFVSSNSYSSQVVVSFVKKYYKLYHKEKTIILQEFILYHAKCVRNAINLDHKIRIKRKSMVYDSTILSNLLANNLKNILSIKFNTTISNIFKIPKGRIYDSRFEEKSINHIFNPVYIWKTIMFIIKTNEVSRFRKGDLQLYNFMIGYPYKKSWTRQRLIKNLMINEPYDNSSLYTLMESSPEKYNMEKLSDLMEIVNISTVNKTDTQIDYTKTLQEYISILSTSHMSNSMVCPA